MKMLRTRPARQVRPNRASSWSKPPGVLSLYWVDNVALLAWRARPTSLVVEEMVRAFEARRAQYPGGMSIVHIGQLSNAMVDAETRETFRRTTAQLDNYLVAVAFVAPGGGFLASTLRSLVTGIMLMVRSSAPYRFHECAEDVLEWLPEIHEQRTHVKLDGARLREALGIAAKRALE
jgi:hypothetical protein